MTACKSKIIVALDYPSSEQAYSLVDQLDPSLCRLKVGKELFTRSGPSFVKEIVGRGYDVFLDLKYHDIPNTVAAACSAAADLGVWMINVHALGGQEMMEAARRNLDTSDAPLLIAVTLLTSSGEKELKALGIGKSPEEFVLQLAQMVKQSDLDGVVSSAQEVSAIKEMNGLDFICVTPGIRLESNSNDDQKRVMTPKNAILEGSDYLVIGRSISTSEDPCKVLLTINSELADL